MLNKQELVSKLKAAALHMGITLLSAVIVWQLILFWYPNGLTSVMNSLAVYKIVMAVELTLGPLMSLIVFSSKKSTKELFIDYSIVGVIQICALMYGLFVVSEARPAYVVFARDRLEIVRPMDIDKKNSEETTNKSLLPSIFISTRYLCVNFPANEAEKRKLFASVLHGIDIHRLPRYYRECEAGEWLAGSKNLESLAEKYKISKEIKTSLSKITAGRHDCGWHRLFIPQGEMVGVVCGSKNFVEKYINLN